MTPAQKWSEEHRPPTPIVDALQKEYHSKMSTRLRIWTLARDLELSLQRRDALLREVADLYAWTSIPRERDLYKRIQRELGDSHD